MEAVTDFLFLGSKITVDGDCSHEIRRCLLLGRKTVTNLDSVLKSRDITLLFNTFARFVITFLLRSNHLLISRLLSPSTVILEPKKRKYVTASMFSPSICHEVMGPDAISFLILSSKPVLLLSSFTLIKKLFDTS